MTHRTLAFACISLGLVGVAGALRTAPTISVGKVDEARFELDPDFVKKEGATLHLAMRAWDRERNWHVRLRTAPGTDVDGRATHIWLTTSSQSALDESTPVIQFGSPYTAHPSNVDDTHIIVLRLDHSFDEDERQKILDAAQEWNYALNSYVRFEVDVPSVGRRMSNIQLEDAWVVARATGRAALTGQRFGDAALAVTQRLPSGGGLLVVFVDQLGHADLRRVMLHEFGHVLGIDHDNRSGLMSTRYVRDRQKCIDRGTIELLAVARQLPLPELNWCHTLAW